MRKDVIQLYNKYFIKYTNACSNSVCPSDSHISVLMGNTQFLTYNYVINITK